MRPSTTRRTAVFAVCLAGVAALYWVPTAVRTPERIGVPAAPNGAPTVLPVSSSAPASRAPATSVPRPSASATDDDSGSWSPGGGDGEGPAATAGTTTPSGDAGPTRGVPRAGESTSVPPTTTTTAPAPSPSATAPSSSSEVSTPPPSARRPGRVRDLHVVQADYEGLTVGWAPVSAAAGYEVSLNGYDVAGTTGTEVALRWFNDDMSEHFVEVRAVGSDGQSSREPGFLRVTRPSSPAPSPTPDPTPSTSPSASPSASATPTGEASPTDQPSPTAQGAPTTPAPSVTR